MTIAFAPFAAGAGIVATAGIAAIDPPTMTRFSSTSTSRPITFSPNSTRYLPRPDPDRSGFSESTASWPNGTEIQAIATHD
jgi:hypothetical protein